MNTVGIFNSITHAAYQLATRNMMPAAEPGKAVFDAKEALADAVSKQDTMVKKHVWVTGDGGALPKQDQAQADEVSKQDTIVKKHAWVTGDAATMPKLGRKW